MAAKIHTTTLCCRHASQKTFFFWKDQFSEIPQWHFASLILRVHGEKIAWEKRGRSKNGKGFGNPQILESLLLVSLNGSRAFIIEKMEACVKCFFDAKFIENIWEKIWAKYISRQTLLLFSVCFYNSLVEA